VARPSVPILHRKSVIAEALAMIDENGFESFTMPALARRLGVKTASLYYHFTDKSELLAGVARAVIREAAPPSFSQDDDWANWFVEMAVNYRRALTAHPNAAPLLVSYPPRQLIAPIYEKGAAILSKSGIPHRIILLLLDGTESLATASALMGAMNGIDREHLGFGDLDPTTYPTLEASLQESRLTPEELLRRQIRSFIIGVIAHADLTDIKPFEHQ